MSASFLPCRPARPWPLPFAAGEMTAKARDEAPSTAAPRRSRGGPLCSRSAVRGLGGLSVFSNQLSPAPLGPLAVKGTGHAHRQGAVLPRRPAPDARPPGRQRPAPGSFLEALPCAEALTVAGAPPKPASAGAPDGPIPQLGRLFRKGRLLFFLLLRLFSLPLPILQKERPALRPASPTHWASILRWCPPGGRRVPWSPRRWRR